MRLRPTSGLVREAIANILGDRLAGARVLDLFAGTGALGIEAISQGAAHATFIDSEAACCQAIVQSLTRAGLAAQGRVLRGKLPGALAQAGGPFEIILLDPPYAATEAAEILALLAPFLAGGGVVVYEHTSRYNPPERPSGLQLTDRRLYGDSAVAFYIGQEGQ